MQKFVLFFGFFTSLIPWLLGQNHTNFTSLDSNQFHSNETLLNGTDQKPIREPKSTEFIISMVALALGSGALIIGMAAIFLLFRAKKEINRFLK